MHEPPEPYDAWREKLRACTPADDAAAKDRLPDGLADLIKSKKAVAIKGRLTLGPADCTLMGCNGKCCNGCEFVWLVIPRRDCPDRKLRVRQVGDYLPLKGSGADCAVRGFGRRATQVIVAGRIAGDDLIVEAELCRFGDEASGVDRLDDADYGRLMSDGRTRKPADDPRCKPTPQQVAPPPKAKPAPPAPRSEQEQLAL